MRFPSVSDKFRLVSVAPRPQFATDVPGAVDYTGQSRAQLYKDMRSGRLPAYKNGTRTILFFDDLDLYLHALPRAKFKPLEEAETEAQDAQPRAVAQSKSDGAQGHGSEADADHAKESELRPSNGDVG